MLNAGKFKIEIIAPQFKILFFNNLSFRIFLQGLGCKALICDFMRICKVGILRELILYTIPLITDTGVHIKLFYLGRRL